MQVVKTQPTGAFTEGGAGIGAVIFDKPQYDTQTIALKVGNDLDSWAAKKEKENAAKKKVLYDMTKDLAVSQNDFLPEGAPHMKAAKDELIDKQTEWLSLAGQYGENSEQARRAYSEAQKAKNKLQIINNNLSEASKSINNFKLSAGDLEKVNMDEHLKRVAQVRVSASKDPLSEEFYSSLQMLQETPQPPDQNKTFKNYLDAVQSKKIKTVIDKNGVITEKETEYKLSPPKKDASGKIVDYGDFNPLTGSGAALSQTKDFQDAVNPMFERMKSAYITQANGGQISTDQKDDAALFEYYTKKAAEQSKEFGQYVSPQTVYANEELMRRNLFSSLESFKTETEARKEAGKQSAVGAKGQKEAENQMRWLIEIGRGSPYNYAPMVRANELGGYSTEFYGTETLGGIKIGDFVEWNGDKKEYVTKPDFVHYFAVDPKTNRKYYASDQSIQMYRDKKSTSPFVPYDNIATIGSKMSFVSGGEMVNLGNYWADIVKKNGWGADNNYINIDPNKVAPISMYEQKGKEEESKSGVVETPFGTTVPYKKDNGTVTPQIKKKEQPAQQQPEAETNAAKKKVVEGKEMPENATPKYSVKTGELIGYELPDGTKYKF